MEPTKGLFPRKGRSRTERATEAAELLYMAFKRTFEKYSGRGRPVTRFSSLKPDFGKNSEMKATKVKEVIRKELEKPESKLITEANKLLKIRDQGTTRAKSATDYINSNVLRGRNRTEFIENAINTVGRDIFTSSFIRNYNESIAISDDEVKDRQVSDAEVSDRPAEQREGETDVKYLKRLSREDRSEFGGMFDQETYDRMEEVRGRINRREREERDIDLVKGREETRKKLESQKLQKQEEKEREESKRRKQAKTKAKKLAKETSQEQVKSENITASESSDDEQLYQLSNRTLPFSISSSFQRTDNFIRNDDETDFDYKERLERGVNIIKGAQERSPNQRIRKDQQGILDVINREIKRLDKIIPQPLSEQFSQPKTNDSITNFSTPSARRIVNSSLNNMISNFSTQTQNNTNQQFVPLTPAQLKKVKQRRRVLERRFTDKPKVKKITTTERLDKITQEVVGARQNISNASIQSAQRNTTINDNIKRAMAEQERQTKLLSEQISLLNTQFPDLNREIKRIESKLQNNKPVKINENKLNARQRTQILEAMPEQYRTTLGVSLNNLLEGNLNLNVVASGLLGLSTIMVTGNPLVGQITTTATNYLLNTLGINFNDYLLQQPQQLPQQPELGEVITNPSSVNVTEQKSQIQNLSTGNETDSSYNETDIEDYLEYKRDDMVNRILERIPQDVKNAMTPDILKTTAGLYVDQQFNNMAYARRNATNIPFQDMYNQPEFLNYLQNMTGVEQSEGNNFINEVQDEKGYLQYLWDMMPRIRNSLPVISVDELIRRLPTISAINKYLPVPLRFPEVKAPNRTEREIPRPSEGEVQRGAIPGMIGAGIPPLIAGNAMGAVGAVGMGAMGGALTAAAISPMIRRHYEQTNRDMNDPEVQKEIRFLQALTPAAAGSILGYSGVGQGLFSGAGVTERKITVDPSVLEETMATEQQDTKQTKKWITKGIFPTPNILDETQQEKFIDDLEYTAFNYIEPTSQGATGTVRTNPLKRSQFLSDQIRYMGAGISTPGMLYNKEFKTNTPQQQMDTYKLGEDMLPQMTFMEQNNADTFNDSNFHFVNNQDQSVEMLSVFNNYSDVRNYWQINERSKLYNLYA
tara:strand:- start:501 stop:3806 length:3306 start_codon:yes stop_codon:yes gene_type:complete